ncbi:unnamed protein product [Toxocara canis]|uniref:G_PROTEIN_RECEP_F1_2 domain-containing protein n=1 Tax=Toxocara canis TaxID=6265 RepID=A0A183TW94_TOXCA|nr:unnamed protein product [Toxocara canis]
MMSAFNISFISSLTIDNVLLPTMTLYLMLTAVGIFGNFSIIIATLKNRRLQRNCNIFIAMCAAGEIVHQAAHIPLAYSVFSGKMFTTLEHCLIIQLIPNLSMNFSMFLMFAIGVDRLLSICNPFRYKQMNRVAYVTTMTTAAIFYASTLLVITVHSGIEDRNKFDFADSFTVPPKFYMLDRKAAVYTGAAKYIWAAAGCTLNLTIIVMYVVVWIIVKRKPGAHANGNAEQHISGGGQWRKLFRSITIAALLVVFGWFATMSAYAVSLATHRTPLQLHCMTILAGIFVNSSIACNYFVFFTFR